MTLREAERRQRQSARDRARDDDRVLTFAQWCETNGFSESTGRRVRKAGRGPRFIQLSDRRIGVTIGDNHAWQQARALSNTNHDD
jgi:predicted DNA-binding transcriptional regulator AlpA